MFFKDLARIIRFPSFFDSAIGSHESAKNWSNSSVKVGPMVNVIESWNELFLTFEAGLYTKTHPRLRPQRSRFP
jgi:hypothetical protein